VAHPSQPNYLALFSGSTQGVTNDLTPPPGSPYPGPSLAGELLGAGFTFAGYSEDLPILGYPGDSFNEYRRAHNPWSDFADVPADLSHPFSDFPAQGPFEGLPSVSFVVPNLLHDMHSGTIAEADQWLEANLGPYIDWAASHQSLFILTWDEDDTLSGNRIPTILVGPMVHPGMVDQMTDHFGVLRMVEDCFGLLPTGAAQNAATLDGVWGSSVQAADAPEVPSSGTGSQKCAVLGVEALGVLAGLGLLCHRRRSPPNPGSRGRRPGNSVG
jgi:acid phosphatase